MQQAPYKKLLSYLYDIRIESLVSDHNESLDLVLSKGRYQLLTQGAIYSYEDKYDNYKFSFQQVDLDKFNINDVLLLGMGMASIPVILERVFYKSYHYTGVEIDDAVIYLTSKYILDDLDSTVEIIETDAYIYMDQNIKKYDMICMDVFIDDKIPMKFHTIKFLELIKNALSPNGILLFNWLEVNNKDSEVIDNYFANIFLQVFPKGYAINLANNRMLINKI